jgi:hypothetical protein
MRDPRVPVAVWALIKPYWTSNERARGAALLVAAVGLTLGLVCSPPPSS